MASKKSAGSKARAASAPKRPHREISGGEPVELRSDAVDAFVSEFNRVFRDDGWQNLMTGLGVANRDKSLSMEFTSTARIPEQTLENLYHENDLVALLCDTLPEEMLRKGFDVKIPAGDDDETGDALDDEAEIDDALEDLETVPKFIEAMVWARLYGGAAIMPVIDDGTPVEGLREPLDENRIQSIEGLNVIEGRYLRPRTWYTNPAEKNYGKAKTYDVTPCGPAGADSQPYEVHESRLILFDAGRVSIRRRQQNGGFASSVVERSYDTIKHFETGWQAVGHLMNDANQAVFSIDGLIHMIASENNDAIQSRMQIVDMGRSVARAIVVDAEKEKFERQSTNFSGLPDILQQFALRLSSAFRMPATITMGQSPAGENATGAADFQWFYDKTRTSQQHYVKPRLRRFIHLLFVSKQGPTGGKEPEKWRIEFRPLMEMTPAEEAEIRNKQAVTDNIYLQAGVVTAEEVALSRFQASGWSPDTTVDLDLRAAIQAMSNGNSVEAGMSPATSAAALAVGGEMGGGFQEDTTLNGAQVQALIDVVAKITDGSIPRSTGVEIINMAFPVDRATAERIIGEAGSTFKKELPEPPPPPPPGQPPQNPTPGDQPPPPPKGQKPPAFGKDEA